METAFDHLACPGSARLEGIGLDNRLLTAHVCSAAGIEQSPRKQSLKALEVPARDAASGGWGDEESDNSTPDVRSWFTKTSSRYALHPLLLVLFHFLWVCRGLMFLVLSTVGTCRGEADRGSGSDRIPNSSLPKDPGKKVAAKERGPKCQCCKQYHK